MSIQEKWPKDLSVTLSFDLEKPALSAKKLHQLDLSSSILSGVTVCTKKTKTCPLNFDLLLQQSNRLLVGQRHNFNKKFIKTDQVVFVQSCLKKTKTKQATTQQMENITY